MPTPIKDSNLIHLSMLIWFKFSSMQLSLYFCTREWYYNSSLYNFMWLNCQCCHLVAAWHCHTNSTLLNFFVGWIIACSSRSIWRISFLDIFQTFCQFVITALSEVWGHFVRKQLLFLLCKSVCKTFLFIFCGYPDWL